MALNCTIFANNYSELLLIGVVQGFVGAIVSELRGQLFVTVLSTALFGKMVSPHISPILSYSDIC